VCVRMIKRERNSERDRQREGVKVRAIRERHGGN